MKLLPKLLITVVGTSVVAGSLASVAAFVLTKASLEKAVTDSQSAYAAQTLDKIDRFLYERQNDIQSIAASDGVQAFLTGKTKGDAAPASALLQRKVSDLLSLTGPWEDLEIVSLDGTVAYSTAGEASEQSVFSVKEDGDAFRQALTGEVQHSDAVYDERLQRVTAVFAAPVRNDAKLEQITGVMIGHLAWPSMLDLLRGTRGRTVALFNAHGQNIADNLHIEASRPRMDATSASVPIRTAVAGNVGVMVAFDPVTDADALSVTAREKGYLTYRGNDWILLLQTPAQAAFAPASSIAVETAGLLAFITFLGTALAALFIRRYVFPIKQLTAGVKRFGREGSMLSPALIENKDILSSGDEIAELAWTFNDMAARLIASHGSLERTVRDRTAQLQAKMQELEQMNRLMVGREVKMAALKKELDALKKGKKK